jgi:hypothetical protein
MKNIFKLTLIFLLIPQVNFGQISSADMQKAWSNLSASIIRKNHLILQLKTICNDSKYADQNILKNLESNANQFTKHLKSIEIIDKNGIMLANNYNELIINNLNLILKNIENDKKIKNSDAYRDIMIQIEGNENRIMIEKNTYNNLTGESSNLEMKFDSTRQKEVPEVKF